MPISVSVNVPQDVDTNGIKIVYKDYQSTFEELLLIDGTFTVHERNIQTLAIELYKVVNNLSPEIMNDIFPVNLNRRYPRQNTFKTFNINTVSWGLETLSNLGPQIWSIIPKKMKQFSLSVFKKRIRQWKPEKCPCRLCKTYIHQLGFFTVSS